MTCDAKRGMINHVPGDLISDLPANVMDDILKLLSLHDAARLSVLSRKWRRVWMSLSHLNFDACFFEKVLKNKSFKANEFFNIVSKILLSRSGAITRFFLHIPDLNSRIAPEIGQLITFLSNNGIREITLENGGRKCLKLPSHLFSCVELESLQLCSFTFTVPPTFESFRNLIKLELNTMTLVGDTFGSFISRCPVLESLMLKHFKGVDDLIIAAPRLKDLVVDGSFTSLCLKDCQGLLSVTVGLRKVVEHADIAKAHELMDLLSSSCKVQELSFKGHFFELFAGGYLFDMYKTNFKHLKRLYISNIFSGSQFTPLNCIRLLHSCPNIEHLTLSFVQLRVIPQHYECKIAHVPCCRLNRLRIASMNFVNGLNKELKIIKFLLASSPVLEKLQVVRGKEMRADLELKLSRELMRFCRASCKAQVIYVDP